MRQFLSVFFAALLIVSALALLLFGKRPSLFILPDGKQTPATGRVIVTFWEKWSREEARALQDLVDKFNLSQDRIYVNLVSMSQINQKMLIATAGGDPPDVAGVWATQMAPFAANQAIEPLDELLADGSISAHSYKPFIWNICAPEQPDGSRRLYAASSTPATCAIYINQDHLREAGLPPDTVPQTMEELDELALKLMRPSLAEIQAGKPVERAGFLPNEPGWLDFAWGFYFGNHLYDEQTHHFNIDTPAQVAAFTWYESYPRRFPDVQQLQSFQSGFGQFNSPQNAFMSGKVSMVLQGPFFARFIERNKPALVGHYRVGLVPLPKALGLPPGSISFGDLDIWVIPRGARHKPAALELLRFLTRQENIEYLCRMHAKPSPLTQVSEGFLQDHPNPYIRLFEQTMVAPRIECMPMSPVWERVRGELNTTLGNMWRTPAQYPVQATLAHLQATCDGYVAEYEYYANLRRQKLGPAGRRGTDAKRP
ncbi:MAG: extracellular solute-binding protein [Phycisphaerae bacterium]